MGWRLTVIYLCSTMPKLMYGQPVSEEKLVSFRGIKFIVGKSLKVMDNLTLTKPKPKKLKTETTNSSMRNNPDASGCPRYGHSFLRGRQKKQEIHN